jgi:hypothetical protein
MVLEQYARFLQALGGAINLHSKLYNVEPFLTPHQEGVVELHRTPEDPGAGAFSYQVMQYKASSSISTGGQMLLNNVIALGDGITEKEYAAMDATVSKLQHMFNDAPSESRDDLTRDVLSFLHSGLLSPAPISDTFPSIPAQIKRAKENGSANAWAQEDTTVKLSWLKTNGVCLDNIVQGTSSIKQAGRDAFTTRILKAGSAVVPTPVIPVARFSLEKYEDGEHQLLRNYCFGHELSSLLLCPYGSPASYVNHTRDERTNAKLVWSTQLVSKHEKWCNTPVDEILKHPEPGLVFELVATKEIEAREEVFMGWHDEWEAHEEEWKAPIGSHLYQSAATLNKANSGTKIKTDSEQQKEPYPRNVYVAARYHIGRGAEPTSSEKQDGGIQSKTYKWTKPSEATSSLSRPVHVSGRLRGIFGMMRTYTIQLMNLPLMHDWDPEYIKHHGRIIVTEAPPEAFFFV